MNLPTCPHNRRFGLDYYSTEVNMMCPHAKNMTCPVVAECRKMNEMIDRLPTPRKSLNVIYKEYQQLMEDLEYFSILHGSLDRHKKGREILTGMKHTQKVLSMNHPPLIQPPRTKTYRVVYRNHKGEVLHQTVKAESPTEAKQIVYSPLKDKMIHRPHNVVIPEYDQPYRAEIIYRYTSPP